MSERGLSIRAACRAFQVSHACCRYEVKHRAEHEEIVNGLLRLTDNKRNWGIGLCFLYLRNFRGFDWNHKRVYRSYRTPELNLRIKPRKRLVHEQPQPRTVPEAWARCRRCWLARRKNTTHKDKKASCSHLHLAFLCGTLCGARSEITRKLLISLVIWRRL